MPKKRTKPPLLSEQIRRAVNESGISAKELCRETGIDKAAMSRFRAGKVGLTMENLDKVAAVIGLRIVVDERETKGGKR